jgi:hypothetical protein
LHTRLEPAIIRREAGKNCLQKETRVMSTTYPSLAAFKRAYRAKQTDSVWVRVRLCLIRGTKPGGIGEYGFLQYLWSGDSTKESIDLIVINNKVFRKEPANDFEYYLAQATYYPSEQLESPRSPKK